MKYVFALSFVLVCISVHSQTTTPLYVVNGTFIQLGNEEFVKKIPIDQIENLTALSHIEATSKYGEFLGSNGMVFIKTRFDVNRLVDIPQNARLTYGDKKPVAVLNGKIIDYDKIDELTEGTMFTIWVDRSIDFFDKYGLQSINGVVTITTK